MNNKLIKKPDDKLQTALEEMIVAIVEIKDLSELKALEAKASGFEKAWEKYAKSSEAGRDQMILGWEVKVRAQRRMGELLSEKVRAGNPQLLHDETIRLDDLGISRIQSMRYQQLAKILDKAFEDKIFEFKHTSTTYEPTTKALLDLLTHEDNSKTYTHDEKAIILHPTLYGENIYFNSGEALENRWDDHIIAKDAKYPTITRLSRFFHEDGSEFSLREYASVQDFPNDYKFIGTYSDIKHQIGNAVSPFMASYVGKKLKGTTVIDLFAGCGGLSCGLESIGKKTLYANEYEKRYFQTYILNFPSVKHDFRDIKNIKIEDIPDADIVVGGPPCQGFSSAGLRIKDDPRNSLYKEFLRIVDGKKPGEFLMENVPEIAEIKDQIISDFNDIGYEVEFEIVKGHDIGMRQSRKRAFFYGQLQK